MTPEETVRSDWPAWSEHNLDHLLALLAPEFVSRSSLSQDRSTDRDRIAKAFQMFDKALPLPLASAQQIGIDPRRLVPSAVANDQDDIQTLGSTALRKVV